MKYNIIFLILITYCNLLIAQQPRFIDTVFKFIPGNGQNNGQQPEFFPKNIFGPPSNRASQSIPESSPNEILSLGLDGEIIVGFKNAYLIDGPGVDFIIFENAFINPINKKIFAEPAIVSVSEDGINYYTFPFDSVTLEGCAGTKPTNGSANPFDITQSGGNGFDLANLGLKKVKYIKIKDISRIILENQNHPYYDPTISGFDLDAVAGIYVVDEKLNSIKNNNSNEFYQLIEIYDFTGRRLMLFENISIQNLPKILPSGKYILKLTKSNEFSFKKICIE